jgi:hypothetical protein
MLGSKTPAMAAESQKSNRYSARRGKDRAKLRLENDPRFLRRIAKARKSLRAGRGVRLEDVK